MKYFGSIMEFTDARARALGKAFAVAVDRADRGATLPQIAAIAVSLPSPRFWVSEKRAADVISALLRDVPVLNSMRPNRRRMFSDIFARFIALRNQHPSRPFRQLVSDVIYSPAPEFYLRPSSALTYYSAYVNKIRHQNGRRQNHKKDSL